MNAKGPLEVLLVDGNNRAGLALSRSLARHGISFLLVDKDLQGPASASRAVKNSILAPCPISERAAFANFLLETIERYKIKLAIPVTDRALILFEQHYPALSSQTRLAMASREAVGQVLDKRINLDIARRVGVPCPKQFEMRDPSEIPEMIRALGFPIVFKNPHPNVTDFKFRVLYAYDEPQLRHYITEFCRDGVYPLFQECAVGEVHNLCCFAAQGEVLAIHEYHSIRRFDGAGVLRKIVAPAPELVEHTRNLLRELKWDGVAHVAFFVGQGNQKLWYMETNGRFWASTEGSVHAGWDFPYWVYRYFLHGEKPVPGEIKLCSMSCWHCGDLRALIAYFLGGEPPATGTHPGKIRATWQYLSGFSPHIHSDIFRWSDPMPGVRDHWLLATELWRNLRKKLAPSSPRTISGANAPLRRG